MHMFGLQELCKSAEYPRTGFASLTASGRQGQIPVCAWQREVCMLARRCRTSVLVEQEGGAGHQPAFYLSLGSWSKWMLLVRLALMLFATAHSALLYGCTERCWLVAGRVQQRNQSGVEMKEEGGVPQTSVP